MRKTIFSKKLWFLVFEVGASLFALLLIIFAIFLGRLSMGPINIDFIIPEIEKALNIPHAKMGASIEHIHLVWREWQRPFEVELENVNLQKETNPHWLKIPRVGISLRLSKLIKGEISIKNLRIYHPRILLEKDENGSFILGFGEPQAEKQISFEEILPLFISEGSHSSLGKLNDLKKISIVDATILLKDDKEHQEWELPKVTFVLKKNKKCLQAELNVKPHVGKGNLTLNFAHDLGASQSHLDVKFNHISFKEIIQKDRVDLSLSKGANFTPDDVLNFLHQLDIPLNGKIYLSFNPETLQVIEGTCDIDMAKGNLKFATLLIQSGNLSLSLIKNQINLKNLALSSDKTEIQLSGKLTSPKAGLFLNQWPSENKTFELNGKLKDLPLNELATLWPQRLAPEAQEWVSNNLREGTLTSATISLKGQSDKTNFEIKHLKGTLEGEKAEITYLKGLPPAQNVKAHANFDHKGFNINILSGNVGKVNFSEGRILITNLDSSNEKVSLDLKAKGQVPEILQIINHKPLEYASYGGIDPKKTKGDGIIDLHLEFPLLADLKFKDIKIDLKGSFQKVGIERKVTEAVTAQLTQGDLLLNLNQDQMKVTGKGFLNQLPSQLIYIQSFKDSIPQKIRIDVETAATFDDFKRLGFDFSEYGKGYTTAKLTYTLSNSKKNLMHVDLDTTGASLVFLPLGWEKKPGERGKISFSLDFEDGQLSKMNNFMMFSPTYSLQGNVLFGPQKKWRTIELSQFTGPHTQAQLVVQRPRDNYYEVTCKGNSINLEKFLEYVRREENVIDHAPTDIKLYAEVGQLRLGEKKEFQNVQASAHLFLQGKETTWKAVKLRAKAGKSVAHSQKSAVKNVAGGILFNITPGQNDIQNLEIRANDAGKCLKTLEIYDDVKEGFIVVKAQRKGKGPFVGVFKLKEFNLNNVPVLARFAALLSPMGVANLISPKETLSMDRFECDFQFSEDLIMVKKGIGKSLALGFTVEGKLDRKRRIFDLKGNVIPARFLNSILSNIPILGSLLNGGEGEGLFAIAYTVSGIFDDPNISLNPLSILAPGFLRKIFQSLGGTD